MVSDLAESLRVVQSDLTGDCRPQVKVRTGNLLPLFISADKLDELME